VLAAGLVVALALVAGGVWLVEFSPVLVTRSVRVEGVPRDQVSKIVARAAVPMGRPLAKADTEAIARRVIATAVLAKVTVSRSYPSTIVISASPRVPVLAVQNSQGQVQVVDAQGVAYATVTKAPKGVPLINTLENPSSTTSMRAALTVLKSLSPKQRARVSKVSVLGPNMVMLKMSGVSVIWGDGSEPQLKVKVMTVLLRQPGVETIDVSAPRSPVTR
jgi:cell division protein FtsQ